MFIADTVFKEPIIKNQPKKNGNKKVEENKTMSESLGRKFNNILKLKLWITN